jgi:hypothetical protein
VGSSTRLPGGPASSSAGSAATCRHMSQCHCSLGGTGGACNCLC